MARRTPRPEPTQAMTLAPLAKVCPNCGKPTRTDYNNYRTLSTLQGVCRFTLRVRRCHNADCSLHLLPYRPEAEGQLALPHHEFGLDVLALVGRLRHAEHRSTAEIHHQLQQRGLALARRTVTNLLDRYDELRSLEVLDPARLRQALASQRQVVLAIDGLQPDVGHEVLWVLRDCISGTVLLARSLLSATQPAEPPTTHPTLAIRRWIVTGKSMHVSGGRSGSTRIRSARFLQQREVKNS